MDNGILHHAQETPHHRRRRRLLHLRTLSPTLQIPGRIQEIQGIKRSRWRVPPRQKKKKIGPHDTLSIKNSGVDARSLKNKLELKAVIDASASYAADMSQIIQQKVIVTKKEYRE